MWSFGDPRLPDRFWLKIQPGECWTWTAARTNGYGYFYWAGRPQNAHRVAYEVLVGSIPEGYDVDHLCHGADLSCAGGSACPHRACVNPHHLEAVPPKINKLRGRSPFAVHAAKTHCDEGHELTEDNLYIERGARVCRICRLATNARYRDANRERLQAANRAYLAAQDPDERRRRAREAQARSRAKKRAERA